jgi:hypothetical protein
MPVHLRRLSRTGLERLRAELDEVRQGPRVALSRDLLESDAFSETVSPRVTLIPRTFQHRLDFAGWLSGSLAPNPVAGIEDDVGVWAWLGVLLFDQLCPAGAGGARNPGQSYRWILEPGNFRSYYRHLLAAPYRIYVIHADRPQRALALLCGPLHQPGELNEQLGSRQELVTSHAAMEVASGLYVDGPTGRTVRGAGGRGPGSPRRLAAVLAQLDVTWDLNLLSADDLSRLLPAEFDRFRHLAAG